MTALAMPAGPLASVDQRVQPKSAIVSLLSKLVILYLLTYVCEGALRFVLSKAHLASILYLRDLLPVVTVIGTLVAWIGGRYRPSVLLISITLLAFHFFIGFFFLGRLFQQLFGIKIFLPMILGLAIGAIGLMSIQQAGRMAAWLIVISVGAIFVNYFVPFPWEGADFDTVFGSGTQSRLWTAGGVRRLGGIARASYDAASILLCAGVVVAAAYRGVWLRSALIILATAGIVLTTSKGAVIAMVALTGTLLISQGGTRLGILRVCVLVCGGVAVIAPILSLLVDVRMRSLTGSAAWLFSSYAERMQYTWPDAFKILTDHGNLVTGRGLGGVGTAQQYGEGRWYTPADNVFVYWTLAFGVMGWVYGAAIFTRLMRWDGDSVNQRLMVFGFFVAAMTYGVTANLMEQPVVCFGIGYAVAVIFKKALPRNKPGPRKLAVDFA